MKSLVVILEGAADAPRPQLEGRTALQAAETPALDGLARDGRLGVTHLAPTGWQSQPEVGLLSCLGYDPKQHPCGRAALEAAAAGIECGPRDQALCGSFVTIIDGVLRDAAPARLSRGETEALLDTMRRVQPEPAFDLAPLAGHRFLAVWRDAGPLPGLRTHTPHEALDQAVRAAQPAGRGARTLANWMRAAGEALTDCELNTVRRDLGENPLTGAWLWGPGPRPRLPMFRERFGVGAIAIGDSALFRGVARAARIETSPGGPALAPLSAADLCAAARSALERYDLVIVHSDEADRAAHADNVAEKVAALTRLDGQLVAPLLDAMRAGTEWRMLIVTPHGAGGAAQRRSELATPFALAGARIESNRGEAFDELHAAEGELRLDRGCDLMEYFLRM